MRIRGIVIGFVLSAAAFAESVAGISWTTPSGWKNQGSRPMRAATYAVPATGGDKEDGECAVFYFGQGQGGDVQANIDRWLGQFQEKPATAPKATKKTVGGLTVTTIEHAGTYMSGGPMSPVKTPKPGYRMVGSIVEAPQGNVFFKLTGPAKTVTEAKSAFDKMIASLKKQ